MRLGLLEGEGGFIKHNVSHDITWLEEGWRHKYPFWVRLYPRKLQGADLGSSLLAMQGLRYGQQRQPKTLKTV